MIGALRRALLRTWSRLLGSLLVRHDERRLDEELSMHVQFLVDEHIRRGTSPEEARRLATLEFGSVEATKDSWRDQRGLPLVDVTAQDLRSAVRAIRRSPGFAMVAVMLMAIGIGADATLFSIVNAVLLRPLPYPESDRLVWVGETRADLPFSSGNPGAVSYQNYLDWRRQQTVFDSIGAYQPGGGSPGAFLIDGEPVRMEIQRLSAGAFAALGVRPFMGRLFTNDEDRRNGMPSVVLSYRTWRERFGARPEVVGQPITMNSVVHTILGVMPPGFSFPYKDIEAWLPLGSMPEPPRGSHDLAAVARLARGVTLDEARAQISAIAAGLAEAYPDVNRGWTGRVEPLIGVVVGDAGRPLWILFGAVTLVLLIACGNLAGLMLARASARQHEMTVRTALGASRGRIIRQLVVESPLLSLIGSALALVFAKAGLATFVALAGNAIPRAAEIRVDGAALSFAAALAGLTGVVFGLAPAWKHVGANLQDLLQTAGGRGSTGEQAGVRHGLIVVEVAMTLLLLASAGLLLRSFQRLQAVAPGFDIEHIVSFDLTIPAVKYRTAALQRHFFEKLTASLRRLPGVEQVGTTTRLPLTQKSGQVLTYSIEGQERFGNAPASMDTLIVSSGYFSVMGMQPLRGRLFGEQDGPDRDKVAIVDEAFANRSWPDADPIGRRIRMEGISGDVPYLTVVGVVARVKLGSLSERGGLGQLYLSATQIPRINASVVLKSRLTAASLVTSIREQVRNLDPAQPIHNVRTIQDVRDSSLVPEKLNLSVLGGFAVVALILSVVGLYGVLAYSVARRQHEIGVRTALGAQPRDVLRLVLGEGVRLTALGMLLGGLSAFWVTRWLSSLLFEITPLDPLTFTAVSMLLLAVALAACWIPAHRAARIDPVQALREP